MWKPLPSRHVLKNLRESPDGKGQRGQYLLAVGLSCFKCHIDWREKRNILYKCVKTFSYQTRFKSLGKSLERIISGFYMTCTPFPNLSVQEKRKSKFTCRVPSACYEKIEYPSEVSKSLRES